MNFHASLGRAALFLLAVMALSVGSAEAAGLAEMQDSVRHYVVDNRTLSRAYDMAWSRTRFERMEQLYQEWAQRLPQLDFEALNQQGRIDYILLRNELGSEMDHLALQRQRLTEMEELLSFRSTIQDLESARAQMKPVDPQSAASQVTQLTERVKKLKERVEKGKKPKDEKKSEKTNDTSTATAPKEKKDKPEEPPLKVSPTLARRTASAVNEVKGTLKAWYSFYDGYQPDFSWWLKKPYDEANTALEAYAKYLKEEVAELKGKDEDPLLGDPIGRESLLRDLAHEMIPYTPEELIAIGELAYFPALSAKQLKYVIEKSAQQPKEKVTKPSTDEKVALSELCRTGGIVNAYEAVKLAATLTGDNKNETLPKPKITKNKKG